jgi:serine/threonine-protein kinase
VPEAQLDRLNAALAGRYRLVRELGHGGMAVVYLADDLRHSRQVAVKVLRAEIAELLGAERFSREITIAARLSHPHILPLHDSGNAGGLLWYVMPWVKGESLGERLRREGQLKTDDAVRIIRQAAAALDHAHAQGLVHRDIKPENILLHEGEAMVADFGIAVRPRTIERTAHLGGHGGGARRPT